ncbi:hypothetical protein GCM10010344_45860 [Streptomyces bluensis]|nr:hypothetical protein GCM10010344_45860 [Streptomyces bluensis]
MAVTLHRTWARPSLLITAETSSSVRPRGGRIDGLAATAALRRQPRPPEVLILTTFTTDSYVLQALRN